MTKRLPNNKISIKDMEAAVSKSGYLIEKRVAKQFLDRKYTVIPSQIIVDPETDKRREIDLVAFKMKFDLDTYDNYGFEVICECENNANPLVFFPFEFNEMSYLAELKYSGFEHALEYLKKIRNKEFFPQYPLVTQYCGFSKPNRSEDYWIASHLAEQHDTINKVKKSIQHRKNRYSKDASDTVAIIGRIHYGLIVLGGEIYLWNETFNETTESHLEIKQAVRYRTIDFNDETNYYEQYYIDIIQESYLNQYIVDIEIESQGIISVILLNKEDILHSIKRSNEPRVF